MAARWYFAVQPVVHLLLKRKFEAFARIAKSDLRCIEMFGIEVLAKPVQQFFIFLIVRIFQCFQDVNIAL